MTVTVLLGDDLGAIRARRAELAESSAAPAEALERYDLSDTTQHTSILVALRTPSMFAPVRHIELAGAEHLTDDVADALTRTSEHVVVWGTRLPAAVKKQLAGVRVENHTAARDPRARLVDLAASHQVTLGPDALEVLTTRCGHDLGRAASVVYSLAVVGLTTPTAADVDRFAAGSGPAPGTPWGVADALAGGDVACALALTEGLEPIAVLGYLGTRLGQVGRIVDSGYTHPEEVASALGVANLAGARRLLAHADRIGARGVAASWTLLATADVTLKRATDPQLALAATLVKLARVWGTPPAG